MYRKILVPLDGSRFSESSLEHLKKVISGSSGLDVVLLTAIDPVSYFSVGELAAANTKMATVVEVQTELAGKAKASAYIEKIAEGLKKEGFSASTVVVLGKPAEEILSYAEQNHVELIIMSTHGKSGISRWAFGSVSDAVVRRSTVPVLIVSPLASITR